ncbi:MAG: 50S ribosome-binding GTPase [Planctomycetota bacterium]|jgi:tRNA modification GTPase|nr:50S ribosome-binding GTPase [Planctomycetota bacterium]
MDTVCACATALPAHTAVLRLSGPRARAVAERCGLQLQAWWRSEQDWQFAGVAGAAPCGVLFAPGPRSYTGYDLVEVFVPGSRDLVELALACLCQAGAEPAGAGAFTRQALATGRLTLDRAEAVLAVAQAADAAQARAAVQRLQGGLGAELAPLRQRLLHLRAVVEAGLDFIEEEDVRAYDPDALQAELAQLAAQIRRWFRAAGSLDLVPTVCLAGPANAGKSALFAALTGSDALVSAQAGTTRDWLSADWDCAGRRVQLIDTAGWLDDAAGLDAQALAAGTARVEAADLVLLCSAPDAPLPAGAEERGDLVVATKSDLGASDPRAVLAVSASGRTGLEPLAGLVARRLAASGDADPRQQALLHEAAGVLATLAQALPGDDLLLADDLARAAACLGDLLGATTPDEVLGEIFGRFCIGK